MATLLCDEMMTRFLLSPTKFKLPTNFMTHATGEASLGSVEISSARGVARAENSRHHLRGWSDPEHQSGFGQFMTPSTVADFMARMFGPLPDHVHLLDAGAGMGGLTAAFVAEACRRERRPKSIHVTLFEIDEQLREALRQTLVECAHDCAEFDVAFSYSVNDDDYIQIAASPLFTDSSSHTRINCAILNPPYAKIRTDSPSRAALRSVGLETSNLYSAFVALALDALEVGGELVAITPRSFCNGPYFASFRRWIFERSALVQAHVYDARDRAFGDDGVLQENVIFRLIRSKPQPDVVRISSSRGPDDSNVNAESVPFGEIVQRGDPERFIRLLRTDEDIALADRVRRLQCSLADLKLRVSTGRVVDFRVRDHLRMTPEAGAVPLLYPLHFDSGQIVWPRINDRKPNALALNDVTRSLVVPQGHYVLTKRFSSKEERRRVVAAVSDPALLPCSQIGFENHLNYYHSDGIGLDPCVARGLCGFLNSTAVDQYFRQFSGHTQVNATDLRSLRYPNRLQLAILGEALAALPFTQEAIDRIVEQTLWSEVDPAM